MKQMLKVFFICVFFGQMQGADKAVTFKEDVNLIMEAVLSSDIDVLERLKNKGADVNKIDIYGKTPLYRAVERSNIAMVQELVRLGADINKVDRYGKTAFYQAVENDNIPMVQTLAALGADINKPENNGKTPFYQAVFNRNIPMVKMLARLNADINKVENNGVSPFCLAFFLNNDKSMSLALVKLGVDVNQVDYQGESLLSVVMQRKNQRMDRMRMLARFEVDINKANDRGMLPFEQHFYARNGVYDQAVLIELIKLGVDVNQINRHGKTFLYWLIRLSKGSPALASRVTKDLIENLLFAGAQINNEILAELQEFALAEDTKSGNTQLRDLIQRSQIVSGKLKELHIDPQNFFQKIKNLKIAEYLLLNQNNDLKKMIMKDIVLDFVKSSDVDLLIKRLPQADQWYENYFKENLVRKIKNQAKKLQALEVLQRAFIKKIH